MFNSFGNIFRLTSFGESHGKGIGGVIDGFPAGIRIDEEFVQKELDRRRPGQSAITTSRKEADKVEFLSGIFEGIDRLPYRLYRMERKPAFQRLQQSGKCISPVTCGLYL